MQAPSLQTIPPAQDPAPVHDMSSQVAVHQIPAAHD
jgi:hypothetical protein